MVGANQEHGIVAHRNGRIEGALQLPVGTQVRILPNHACSTAAQYGHDRILRREGPGAKVGNGPRCRRRPTGGAAPG